MNSDSTPLDAAGNLTSTVFADEPTVRIGFRGTGGELFAISVVNSLLTLVTLGVYAPWARARLLGFLIDHTIVDGDALTFHGTGRELFFGWLRALLIFVLPLIALSIAMSYVDSTGVTLAATIGFYVLLVAFLGVATVGAARYRLSRTSWRGIRFSHRARVREFLGGYLPRIALVALTLGLAYPAYATWRRRFMLERSRFGSAAFGFDGNASELYARFILAWLFWIPTIGLMWIWYAGEQQAYFWNSTTFQKARFRCTMNGGRWLGLTLVNGLLALITLGLAAPAVQVYMLQGFLDSLTLEGRLDLDMIRQEIAAGSALGEELGGLLDVDSDIGPG